MAHPVPDSRTGTSADILYDAFYSGGIGGSVVALFFLLVDLIQGQALFTPSLMGSVLFEGAAAADVVDVSLAAVAYYTLLHFVVFCVLGFIVAFLVHEVELHAKHPILVLLAAFVLFEAAFFVAAAVLMPGVVARVGPGSIALANLLAAAGMTIFLLREHRPDVWSKVTHPTRAD
jgi:hypothetical protein